ncbi:MAG TPA: SMP-30/gluconolactonase/LRE family protein [Jatrophihabitantaceae bacterium]|nr:SMP-30/gluconolactonase/LRE family protein [Jatrophihabitantaceae bacterium]
MLDVEVLAEGLRFPEAPIAMPDGSIVFVEVHGGLLSRVDASGTLSTVAFLGGAPNAAAVGPDGAIYVCNKGGGSGDSLLAPCVQRVDLDTGSYETIYPDCAGIPFGRPNDLVFDASGRFWFTDTGRGAIFYASPDGSSIRQVLDNLWTPNGIVLSPDDDVLYWAETVSRQVLRRRVAAPGQLIPSSGHDVKALLHGGGVDPFALLVGMCGARQVDGLAVEADGTICVACLVDSGIMRVSTSGDILDFVPLPAAIADGAVSNLCFGGADMRTAYVTLGEHGRLVSCRWPRPGLRLRF